MQQEPHESRNRWAILLLGTLTNTLAVAAPSMCLPVLFADISTELKLSLVQVGVIWGISALPGIVTGFLGGAASDRFGPRRVLIGGCLMIGLFGALRGLANSFLSLAATMFLLGVFTPFITINTLKMCGMWFPRRQLGLASGVLSMGMALGFLLGSMFSATLLSPWLGGWRPVLFLYGAIAFLLCIPWIFTRPGPEKVGESAAPAKPVPLPIAFRSVALIRNVWLFGLALLGISGCIQGALGYLPLYLQGLGWPEARADAALAAFHTLSMIFVIPIAIASDRLGSRKRVLSAAGLMITLGVGLLSVAGGPLVWLAVGMAGMVRDGFMAVFMTSIIETDSVGTAFAGTAIGVVMVFSGLGNLLAPPLGNSLSAIGPGLPFIFWSAMAAAGLAAVLATSEKRAGKAPERFTSTDRTPGHSHPTTHGQAPQE
jgi:MFS family permease